MGGYTLSSTREHTARSVQHVGAKVRGTIFLVLPGTLALKKNDKSHFAF